MAENWKEYVRDIADDYGVDFENAWTLFELLGELEAYDGFITMIQDYADEMY